MRPCSYLAHLVLVCVSQIFKVRVFEQLRAGKSVVCVIDYHFHYHILSICAYVRNKLRDSNKLLRLEVELHVSGMPKSRSYF